MLVSPDLGVKKLTDMKLISVNGVEVLLSEMMSALPEKEAVYTTALMNGPDVQPILTTTYNMDYSPVYTTTVYTAETADTTVLPTA